MRLTNVVTVSVWILIIRMACGVTLSWFKTMKIYLIVGGGGNRNAFLTLFIELLINSLSLQVRVIFVQAYQLGYLLSNVYN